MAKRVWWQDAKVPNKKLVSFISKRRKRRVSAPFDLVNSYAADKAGKDRLVAELKADGYRVSVTKGKGGYWIYRYLGG